MTKIKLCGLRRSEDILIANALIPDYIGFVFAKNRTRTVSREEAEELKKLLIPKIKAVGVFINENPETVASLLNDGIIDLAQLHGDEDNDYIRKLRSLTDKQIIKAYKIKADDNFFDINNSLADYILLDSGTGSGRVFDWELLKNIKRPYFLAGGLNCANVEEAILTLSPFAVDVSSGIETDGFKDKDKMRKFVELVKKCDSIKRY